MSIYQRLNQHLVFTGNKSDVKECMEKSGGWVFRDGEAWDIKTKHLGAGIYNIWLKKRKID
jgi:hypothetical protein